MGICLALSGAVFPVQCSTAPDPQLANSPLTLNLLVFNYLRASPTTLARAEREAGGIFKESGIRVAWLSCQMTATADSETMCRRALRASDIVIRILSTKKNLGDSVFGFAVAPTFASVYYDAAFRWAKMDGTDYEAPVVLGFLIAHEVGHLLLGSNSHSAEGIMMPCWHHQQILEIMTGYLHFTAAESALMQTQVRERIRYKNMAPSETVREHVSPGGFVTRR